MAVTILEPGALTLPNVITDNGDGKNDFFLLPDGLAGSSLHVFNRWGKTVFADENYQNNWNGANLPEGTVYYYMVNGPCLGDELKDMST